ncbi:MAG: hypothetical protein N3A62_05785 [Thermodesulfovibrionales bacterium]|nr:hypothetical protein [Thermodesulfovibrionales bacterium]
MSNQQLNPYEIIFDILYNTFGPQNWWPADTPFEVAVGAILTQNTNWNNVKKAIHNLKASRMLSPRSIHNAHEKEIANLIKPSGYFNIKAKRLKNLTNFIVNECNGSLMNLLKLDKLEIRRRLLSISGIGKETADSIILYALQKPIFVIDAYTKRLLFRHKLINSLDIDYDECQMLFHSNLKNDVILFNEYHALIVKVGKEYCKKNPFCTECPLNTYS